MKSLRGVPGLEELARWKQRIHCCFAGSHSVSYRAAIREQCQKVEELGSQQVRMENEVSSAYQLARWSIRVQPPKHLIEMLYHIRLELRISCHWRAHSLGCVVPLNCLYQQLAAELGISDLLLCLFGQVESLTSCKDIDLGAPSRVA